MKEKQYDRHGKQSPPEPAYINASDDNLDDQGCCRLCGMVWYNCLCGHDDLDD